MIEHKDLMWGKDHPEPIRLCLFCVEDILSFFYEQDKKSLAQCCTGILKSYLADRESVSIRRVMKFSIKIFDKNEDDEVTKNAVLCITHALASIRSPYLASYCVYFASLAHYAYHPLTERYSRYTMFSKMLLSKSDKQDVYISYLTQKTNKICEELAVIFDRLFEEGENLTLPHPNGVQLNTPSDTLLLFAKDHRELAGKIAYSNPWIIDYISHLYR